MAFVRRRSSAFSRGKSRYRGVSGHNGRWEARIGSFGGRKNVIPEPGGMGGWAGAGLGRSGEAGALATRGVRSAVPQGRTSWPLLELSGHSTLSLTHSQPALLQVSFGVYDSEEEAARQYDRALIVEKGRSAKTNFPVRDYDVEVAEFEAWLFKT